LFGFHLLLKIYPIVIW